MPSHSGGVPYLSEAAILGFSASSGPAAAGEEEE